MQQANQAIQDYFGNPQNQDHRMKVGREEAARFHNSAKAYFQNQYFKDLNFDKDIRPNPQVHFARLDYENERERVRRFGGPEQLIDAYRCVDENGERTYDPRRGRPQNTWMERADHLTNVFEIDLPSYLTGERLYTRFKEHIDELIDIFHRYDKIKYKDDDFKRTDPTPDAQQALEAVLLYRQIRTLTYAQFKNGQQGTPQEPFAEGDPTAALRLRYIYKYVNTRGLSQRVEDLRQAAKIARYNVGDEAVVPMPVIPRSGPAPEAPVAKRGRGRGRGGRGEKKRSVENNYNDHDDDGIQVVFSDQGGSGMLVDSRSRSPPPGSLEPNEDNLFDTMEDRMGQASQVSTPARSLLASNSVPQASSSSSAASRTSSLAALSVPSGQRQRVQEPEEDMETSETSGGYRPEEGDNQEFMAFIMIILGWEMRSSFVLFLKENPIDSLATTFFSTKREWTHFRSWAIHREICGKRVYEYYTRLYENIELTLAPRIRRPEDEPRQRYQSLRTLVQGLVGTPSDEQIALWLTQGNYKAPNRNQDQTAYTAGDLWTILSSSLNKGRRFNPTVVRLAEIQVYRQIEAYITGISDEVSLFVLHLIRLFALRDLNKSKDARYTREQIEARFAYAGGTGCGPAPLFPQESNTPFLPSFEFMPSAAPPSSILSSSAYFPPLSSSSSSSAGLPPPSSSSSSVLLPFTSASAAVNWRENMLINPPPSSSSSSTMPAPTTAYPQPQPSQILPPIQPSSSSAFSSSAPPSGPPPVSRSTHQGPEPFSALTSRFAGGIRQAIESGLYRQKATPSFSPWLDPTEKPTSEGPYDKSDLSPPDQSPSVLAPEQVPSPVSKQDSQFVVPSQGSTPSETHRSAPSSPRRVAEPRENASSVRTPDRGYFNDQDILSYLSAEYENEYQALQAVALPRESQPGAKENNIENVLRAFQSVNM